MGTAYLAYGLPGRAVDVLRLGRSFDGWGRWDFAFEEGRALFALGRYPESIACFRQAAGRCEDVLTLVSLGVAHEKAGQPAEAMRAYQRGRELADPEDPQRDERIEALRKQLWQQPQEVWG